MEWSISYMGVAIAVLFAATGGVILGMMYSQACIEVNERRDAKISAVMETRHEPGEPQ